MQLLNALSCSCCSAIEFAEMVSGCLANIKSVNVSDKICRRRASVRRSLAICRRAIWHTQEAKFVP